MALVYGITDQGVQVPRVADWLAFMRQEFEGEVNETVDFDGASKSIGLILAIAATGLGEVSQATQLIASQNDRNAARGIAVDNLGSYTLTPRLNATRSLVTITCTGTNGTAIAQGKQVRDNVTGEVWRSRADATITGGSVDVEFEAVNLGPITAAPGDITEIRTAVSGWTGAINNASAIPGRARETDNQYNIRQITDLARDSANTALSVRANLLTIGNTDDSESGTAVQAVAIIENDLPETQTVEGVSLPRNSVAAYIYPQSVDTTYRSEIAEKLWRFVTSGTTLVGTETATVIDAAGREKTVKWNWVAAEPVNITVNATVFPGGNTADVQARIEQAITDYFASLAVGQDVSRLDLIGDISDLNKPTPIIKTSTLLINGSGINDAEITILQRAITGTVTVNVT